MNPCQKTKKQKKNKKKERKSYAHITHHHNCYNLHSDDPSKIIKYNNNGGVYFASMLALPPIFMFSILFLL